MGLYPAGRSPHLVCPAGLRRALLRQFESCLLHLSPDDIAAAEACGVSFIPASAAQVQRLAMQRKVFYQAGTPILATRGDGFFETVGTLQHLIEESRAQQRDLAQWLEAEAEAEAMPGKTDALTTADPVGPDLREVVAMAALAPTPEPGPEPVSAAVLPEADAADSAEVAPKRSRQKRRRPAVIPWIDPAMTEAAPEPVPPGPLEMDSPARSAARTESAVLSVEDRGKRWLIAGAARRGRAGKHWSTRQR